MKQKTRAIILGIYDLWLAKLAITTGISMIKADRIFIDYPQEWLSKVPFESWFVPGLIAIFFFGLGNVISALFCFINRNKQSWVPSLIMGNILFVSLILQINILGETFLATGQLLFLSIIQLCFSWYVFKGRKPIKKV